MHITYYVECIMTSLNIFFLGVLSYSCRWDTQQGYQITYRLINVVVV
jgi:hypothetical protein